MATAEQTDPELQKMRATTPSLKLEEHPIEYTIPFALRYLYRKWTANSFTGSFSVNWQWKVESGKNSSCTNSSTKGAAIDEDALYYSSWNEIGLSTPSLPRWHGSANKSRLIALGSLERKVGINEVRMKFSSGSVSSSSLIVISDSDSEPIVFSISLVASSDFPSTGSL